jgi:Protein of unknown function (DUF1499)
MFIAKAEPLGLSWMKRGEEAYMSDETSSTQSDAETVDTTVDPVVDPVVAAPVETAALAKTSDWSGKSVLWLGLASPAVALIGALGSAWGFWPFGQGFLGLAAALVLAVLAIAIGAGVGARNRKKGIVAPKTRRWIGMALGVAMIGWLASVAIPAFTVPAIHDISTDLADPPQFQMLALRKDNWDNVPGTDDANMKGMSPQQRWEVIHRGDYGDIRTVRINEPVVDVISKADRLAKVRGWDVAVSDPVEGRLEATATSTFFRFKDDVVLRVKPTEDGTGSVVDMRSVSRMGVSDIGVNAKRVRAFLADLSGTVTGG